MKKEETKKGMKGIGDVDREDKEKLRLYRESKRKKWKKKDEEG